MRDEERQQTSSLRQSGNMHSVPIFLCIIPDVADLLHTNERGPEIEFD